MIDLKLPSKEDIIKKNKNVIQRASKLKKVSIIKDKEKAALEKRLFVILDGLKDELIDHDQYEIINNYKKLDEYFQKARMNKILAIDTETTGLDPLTDHVVGICIYTPGERAAYIPLYHTDLDGTRLSGQLEGKRVKELLETIVGEVGLIFHNAKFDLRMLKHSGLIKDYIDPLWDSYLASMFLNENEKHGLKYLWNSYCNDGKGKVAAYDDLFEKIPFNYIPIEVAYLYGAKDALMTYELYKFQEKYLDPENEICISRGLKDAAILYQETEIPLISIIAGMEDEGIKIDLKYAKGLEKKYKKEMIELQKNVYEEISKLDLKEIPEELFKKLGNPINLNSPLQLSILIYDGLELRSPEKDMSRGTGEKILKYYIDNNNYADLFRAILDYRKIKKLMTTYITKIPKLVREDTEKVHYNFNQYGARTGRFSSSNPNMQNIPARNEDIRKMFIPEKGKVFVCADYSQQEPRILAHVSGDRNLIKAYKENRDIYAWVGSLLYNLPYEECLEAYSEQAAKRRYMIKQVILGIMYGRGVASVAEELKISKKEAQELINLFFDTFKAVEKTIDGYIKMAKFKGYVTTVYGRKRRLPEIDYNEYDFSTYSGGRVNPSLVNMYLSRLNRALWDEREGIIEQAKEDHKIKIRDNTGKIAYAKRQCLNSVIQGTAADITKRAMVLVGKDQRLKDLGYKMLLQVHDELIGTCREDVWEDVSEIVAELMIKAADGLIVPMKVDIVAVDRWYGEEIERGRKVEE
jgi:DNA polymerase-1